MALLLAVDAVVAYKWVGEDEDLAGKRRVGEHLLVSGHRSREDDLAVGASRGAEGLAFEGSAVFEDEEGSNGHQTPFPRRKLASHDLAQHVSTDEVIVEFPTCHHRVVGVAHFDDPMAAHLDAFVRPAGGLLLHCRRLRHGGHHAPCHEQKHRYIACQDESKHGSPLLCGGRRRSSPW